MQDQIEQLSLPRLEIERQVRKDIKNELLQKVKHFKDETFGELQALEIENEQLHKENI